MKKTKRKLSLGKETLQNVSGAGPLASIGGTGFPTLRATCGCPIASLQGTCHAGCSIITCGNANTCAPWGCQSQQPTCTG